VELYFEGDWRRSEEQYERSVAVSTRIGAVVDAATSTNNIGEILSDQGRLDEAETRFRNALRVWRGAGFAIGIALATSNLGRLHSRAGRVAEAMPLLESAVARFERIGAASFTLEAHGRIAETMMVAREPGPALARVEQTIASADTAGERGALAAWLERLAACALVQIGDTVEARKRLENQSGGQHRRRRRVRACAHPRDDRPGRGQRYLGGA